MAPFFDPLFPGSVHCELRDLRHTTTKGRKKNLSTEPGRPPPPPLLELSHRGREKRESYFVPFGDFYFSRAEAITAYTQKEGGGEAWRRQEEVEPPPSPVEPLYYTPDRVELMAGEMVVVEEGEEEAGAIVIADLMKPFDRPIELRNTTPERP